MKPAKPERRRGRYPYPFEWYEFFRKDARLRRATNRLTMARIRLPLPWYRFMQLMVVALFMLDVPLWLFAWAFVGAGLGFGWMTVFFAANMVFLVLLLMAVVFHGWVAKYYPKTTKVCVGSGPELVSDDCKPGQYVAAVELPADDSAAPVTASVTVEVIPYGTVRKTPETLAPIRGYVVARCMRTTSKGAPAAGTRQGKRYVIPAVPLPYIAGDVAHLRGVDWRKLIEELVEEPVNDWHRIVLALDPIDPVTWDPPKGRPALEMEVYSLRQRNARLNLDLDNQGMEDGMRREDNGD